MKRTASPTHELELPFDYNQYAEQFLLTYSQNKNVVLEFSDKDIGKGIQIEGSIISVFLSQEDTRKFSTGEAFVELKVYTKTKKSIISDTIPIYVKETLNEKVFT